MSTETITPELVADEQKEIALVVQQNAIQPETALNLQSSFAPFFTDARKIMEQSRQIVVTDASQKLQVRLAREFRLALRAVRIGADKVRKELKEDSDRKSKAIQGFYNILLHLTETEEQRLDDQEKFALKLEAEQKAKLKAEREEALRPYGIDVSFFQLGEMPEASFVQLLENTKAAHEAKVAAARKAEEDRIRAENERLKEEARIRRENEALRVEAARIAKEREAQEAAWRAEAEEKAAKARIEREAAAKEAARIKAEADAKLAEERQKAEVAAESARKEREAIELAAKKEREFLEAKAAQERRDAEAKAKIEREAREKVEAELKRQRDAEAKRKKEEEAAAKKAAAAPDKAKLSAYWTALDRVIRPDMATLEGSAIMAEMDRRMAGVAAWLKSEAEKLG